MLRNNRVALTKKMIASQGWRFHQHGHPEKVLQFEKFRLPFDTTSDDVVVKMIAAPVHKNDKNMIQGTYGPIKSGPFPAIAGIEGVGIVDNLGTKAQGNLKEGDLVWINNQKVGTFATHIVTSQNNLDVVPNRADIEIEFLASLTTFHTAWHLAHDMVKYEVGDTALVAGGSSAVNQVLFSYLRSLGVKSFATMRLGRNNHAQFVDNLKGMGCYANFPYSYAKTNYLGRLLSDVPAPKAYYNAVGGPYGNTLMRHLGEDATVINYGAASSLPHQVPNMDMIRKNIQFKGFFLPEFQEKRSKEARMRVHKNVIETMTLGQGKSKFYAQRFRMDVDSSFAFSNAFGTDMPQRKSILRMNGEYGEFRKPDNIRNNWMTTRSLYEDAIFHFVESQVMTDTPGNMKYYTPFGDVFNTVLNPDEAKEAGHRSMFLRYPDMPRHNDDEASAQGSHN